MTAKKKLSVDDLRDKAREIETTVREDARRVLRDETVKIVIVGALVIVTAISMAYYLGSRRCRS